MNEMQVITVTQEENEQLSILMRLCRESFAATRAIFESVDVGKLSERELALIHATMLQFSAMEELLRVLVALFLKAKPEVIQ